VGYHALGGDSHLLVEKKRRGLFDWFLSSICWSSKPRTRRPLPRF
jgi:hypothetical protein